MPDVLDMLVMNLIEEGIRPLTVYDISRQSSDRGSPLTPTQVYRVLDRLLSRGVVQRIELLAAYLPVRGEQKGHLVCRCCRSIETFPISILAHAIDTMCQAVGFSRSRALIEVSGICTECAGCRSAQVASTKRKGGAMKIRRKSLLALLTTAGMMLAAGPADAAECRSPIFCEAIGYGGGN